MEATIGGYMDSLHCLARQAFATTAGQAHQSLAFANLGLVPNVRNMLGVLREERSLRRVARQAFATTAGQAHQSLRLANLGLVPNVRTMLGVLKDDRQEGNKFL